MSKHGTKRREGEIAILLIILSLILVFLSVLKGSNNVKENEDGVMYTCRIGFAFVDGSQLHTGASFCTEQRRDWDAKEKCWTKREPETNEKVFMG
ncbi:hypothetical protein HB904_17325 [Listeria booriae]|uniref:Uncharacterized protein n=1 Tax=Listeria booriae TaxID=1552123 RepID=A0A842AN72_9LIST|nr:hypothetical protein [Listeria booriae]